MHALAEPPLHMLFISSQTRISTNGAFMLGIWQRIQKWKKKKTQHHQTQTFPWQGT